jgi:hypothetical protein
MSRWTLLFALALACWLPVQSAFAWLPVQQPVMVDASMPDSSRSFSASAAAMHSPGSMADCHAMLMPDTGDDDSCHMQVMWSGMDHGTKHCSACVQVPGDVPRLDIFADLGPRQPDSTPELRAVDYYDFIPGIPVPPPCHSAA